MRKYHRNILTDKGKHNKSRSTNTKARTRLKGKSRELMFDYKSKLRNIHKYKKSKN